MPSCPPIVSWYQNFVFQFLADTTPQHRNQTPQSFTQRLDTLFFIRISRPKFAKFKENYDDYQLSKARRNLVKRLKLQCCQGQLSWFPVVTIKKPCFAYHGSSPNYEKTKMTRLNASGRTYVKGRPLSADFRKSIIDEILRNEAIFTLAIFQLCCLWRQRPDKLPLETEPVAPNNNTILTLKPGD